MTQLAFFVFCSLLFLALVQAVLAGLFFWLLFRHRPAAAADAELPRAAILLPVRGADPDLAEGLRRLLQQDYPDYELHIAIDRRDDPAWDLVQQAAAGSPRVPLRLTEVREPLPTCSRKCSALLRMVAALDESREVVALVDSDVVPHSRWLRELVAPLRDPRVGAAFGNRWYMPRYGDWGSLVRYLWNAAAVVPMWLCNIPWAGSFAIRAKVLRESGLLKKWSLVMAEDAPAKQALENQGLRLRFVPSLMMVNREDCTFAFSLDFIKRQLTWTRLYHPNWWLVVAHAILTTAVIAAALVLIFAGWASGEGPTRLWASAGMGLYLAAMLLLTALIESGVRHVVRARGGATGWLSPRVLARLPAAVLLAQAIHLTAVVLAVFKRSVKWRGATYRIAGPWDVRLVDERPMARPAEAVGTNMSL